jgi:hypothetical protein
MGYPPYSMSELPTDTPLPALHVTMARRNFPGESSTVLLYSRQAKNAKIWPKFLDIDVFFMVYTKIYRYVINRHVSALSAMIPLLSINVGY